MKLMVLMKQENVDVRLPCGMTPLMVAAVKGGGLDTGEEEEEDGTAAVIADLVAQGAELNATMDKTGETSLHLAARYITLANLLSPIILFSQLVNLVVPRFDIICFKLNKLASSPLWQVVTAP